MLKLTKGLKKKKKGKKGKKEEDDELYFEGLERLGVRSDRVNPHEAIKQSSDTGSTSADPAKNDEWKKFVALTAGVDDILKKTQSDLDRIKSSSFYQRKEEEKSPEEQPTALSEADNTENTETEPAEFDVSKHLIEEPKNDVFEDVETDLVEDVFDTTFIDVFQNKNVQLIQVPDSPTFQELKEDPFDTTTADKILKTVDKTGRKLVSIGNAVEILSGRVERPRNFIPPNQTQKDIQLPEANKNLAQSTSISQTGAHSPNTVISKLEKPDTTQVAPVSGNLQSLSGQVSREDSFEEEFNKEFPVTRERDPFDTSIAGNLLPSKIELKFIEEELGTLEDQTKSAETPNIRPGGLGNLTNQDKISLIQATVSPPKKNLIDEVTSDLNILKEVPIQPLEAISYVDPFDTSNIKECLPGKTELKVIEQELLTKSPEKTSIPSFKCNETLSSIDKILGTVENPNIKSDQFDSSVSQNKKVEVGPTTQNTNNSTNFQHESLVKQPSLLDSGVDVDEEKLDPVISEHFVESSSSFEDPFDTTIASNISLGKTEIKFLEKELNQLDEKPILPNDVIKNVLKDTLLDNKGYPSLTDEHSFLSDSLPIVQNNILETENIEIDEIDPFDTNFVSDSF